MLNHASRCRTAVETAVRQHYGKLLAFLMRQIGDLELAEDSLQDAILTALEKWPKSEIPNRPDAWLLQVAKRKSIDRLRRVDHFEKKKILLTLESSYLDDEVDFQQESFPDERLKLIFTCCHPALAVNAQIALTLQTLCGLNTQQIAKAFVVSESTMAQRIVRAKRKIKATNIPFSIPAKKQLPDRVNQVLNVLYLIFNEGYLCSDGNQSISSELCDEAIRLATLVMELIPNHTESMGLLALMLFIHSRNTARRAPGGELVDLQHQDRSQWNKVYIKRGDRILKAALMSGALGRFQIQAAINAVHTHSPHFNETDWRQITLLYHKLQQYDSSPIVQLNQAVAYSYAVGPKTGLEIITKLSENANLTHYQPLYAAKADMLKRLGHLSAARQSYDKAISLSQNPAEVKYLKDCLRSLDPIFSVSQIH